MADNLPDIPQILPVVATTNLVIYPYMLSPLTVGRERSMASLDAALAGDRLVAIAMQRDADAQKPTPDDIHSIGAAAAILRMNRVPDGTAQIIVQGLVRVRLSEFTDEDGVLRAHIEQLSDPTEKPATLQALMNNLMASFQRMVELSPALPEEAFAAASAQDEPGKLADFIASTLNLEPNVRQEILEELNVQARLERVTKLAAEELSVLELTAQIQNETRKELDKGQREFILRQQLREIQKQLGEDEDSGQELEDLKNQVADAKMPPEAQKAADRELKRLVRIPPASPEYSVTRNYLDWLIAVPWSVQTEDNLDIAHARKVLNDEHYDMEDIKERILEYLAVRRLKPDGKGPILCLVGPPGVGKTSLAHSIASALGRKFVRMALGGVRDEAEIRGHRRTYIGALPGRIVQGLRDAGTNNPLMILDEVDKLGSDYRGDPTSALLEVLDPQQNDAFKDHYLEVPVDLSRIIFITTANVLDTIPGPLRDRMEILRVPGYTEEEKVQIAIRHLTPRQLEENGLTADDLEFSDEALRHIARHYTREAGVRNLEREIASVVRKVARKIAESGKSNSEPGTRNPELPYIIEPTDLEEYLGPEKIQPEMGGKEAQVGVSTGLAWTPAGGEILFIETAKLPGKGGLTLTGQLGDVMKESAQIALDFLRANWKSLNIPQADCQDGCNLHLHVPAGAIPKDGPSAGVAITTALASQLSGRAARHDIAMTGEVTLTGRVLPVGGIKEKVLAARQAGISHLILPERNRADVKDIPEDTRKELQFDFIHDVREALEIVLLPLSEKQSENEALDVTTPAEQDTSRGNRVED